MLIKKERQSIAPLEVAPGGAPPGTKCYKVSFKKPIKAGKTQEFDVVATITGVYNPNPSMMEQTDTQYVEYLDSLYLLTPYQVKAQTTTVRRLEGTAGTGGG